jgi:hypothetical protein
VTVFADAVNGIQVTGFQREPRTLESLLTISVNRLDESSSPPGSPAAHASRPHFTSTTLPDVEEANSMEGVAEANCDRAMSMERYRSAPLEMPSVEGSASSASAMNSFTTKRGLVRQVSGLKLETGCLINATRRFTCGYCGRRGYDNVNTENDRTSERRLLIYRPR